MRFAESLFPRSRLLTKEEQAIFKRVRSKIFKEVIGEVKIEQIERCPHCCSGCIETDPDITDYYAFVCRLCGYRWTK